MSEDIVVRLRDERYQHSLMGPVAMREAASTIEALRGENARLKAALEALSAVRSDLPEKVSEWWLYEGVRHWHRNCDWDEPIDGSPLDRGDGATVAKLINMIPRKALAGETEAQR